jgi:hypothetical protein
MRKGNEDAQSAVPKPDSQLNSDLERGLFTLGPPEYHAAEPLLTPRAVNADHAPM